MKHKKKYERPSMMVVELKQRAQLLAGSGDGNLPNMYPGDEL